MNESVFAMIAKLHARLNDLAEVVEQIPFELNGYDKKLDRVDDQVYLIEVELENKLKSSIKLEPISEEDSEAFESAQSKGGSKKATVRESEEVEVEGEEKEEGILTESAKKKIAGAAKSMNAVYKEGKETFGEFSEAFGDIKDALAPAKKFFKKR